VTIHQRKCLNLMKMSKERQIDVQWSGSITESYPASIKVITEDRFGLLADIASVISKYKVNIVNTKSETHYTGLSLFYFTFLVESSDQLRTIMSDIKKIKKVTDVKRIIR